MARRLPYYTRPRALAARIDELEQLRDRSAASFDDLLELTALENRKYRRMQEGKWL
tara:strand:+ start:1226 stop:1393 length:168 start_codon:yes stop_codon:yes gene_type:complete